MDLNSRCPITLPQHDWWRLHINVSTIPIRTNTCLQWITVIDVYIQAKELCMCVFFSFTFYH